MGGEVKDGAAMTTTIGLSTSSGQVPEGMKKVWSLPQIVTPATHALCAGCGEPIAVRIIGETLEEMGLRDRTIGVFGIGCYGALGKVLDIDKVKALHGRAPSVATGIKRVRPETFVFTVQGDGDMASEGLQEALHAAARKERITLIMLNNTVFGETGGHMTATTMVGQKTKNTLKGRNPETEGSPIKMAELVAQFDGTAYSARGSVHSPVAINRTRKLVRAAFEAQVAGKGLSFVEIMTMCPTGWFMESRQAPQYMEDVMLKTFRLGEYKTG